MTEMVIADFNSSSVAEAAIRDLENAQIPSAAIKSYSKDEPSYQEYRTRQPEHQGGFWSWLIGEEPTQTQEYGAYDTSLASGHTVVTVTVDELHADAVMGILNQHGPREIHEQASGGSETYQTGAYPAARTASTSRVNGGKDEERGRGGHPACRGGAAGWQAHRRSRDDEHPPLRRPQAGRRKCHASRRNGER